MDLGSAFALIGPESILALTALVLLLVVAWVGDKSSRAVSILSCVALGACFLLVAPAVCAGAAGPDTVAFGGFVVELSVFLEIFINVVVTDRSEIPAFLIKNGQGNVMMKSHLLYCLTNGRI